ncbi:MAG TPA: lamin tail domain-containing protein [Kribbella sp.]
MPVSRPDHQSPPRQSPPRQSPRSRRAAAAVVALALAAAPSLFVAAGSTAYAASTDVVIAEAYGGGGNSGAPYLNDFVELQNRSTAAVSVAGWSVQYASAAGTTWSTTALSGSIAAGGRYLVRLGSGGSTGAALPTPEATGTTNMSATAGKIALVTSSGALACGSVCHAAAGVKDYLGYGTANDYETTAAPAGSNTASLQRKTTADTDNNSADFATGAPNPQNSAGGGTGGTRIHDIQGAAHLSPKNNTSVTGVPGIVTALSAKGFWMQDAMPDASVATSEAIYVFQNAAPTVAVGDSVTVDATVAEFRPGGTSGTKNLTTTQLGSPTVTKVSSGNALPAAQVVGSGGRVPPASVIDDDATGDVETSGTFDATTDGIDFWESLEGMRVSIASPKVVGPTNAYGEIPVVPAGSGTATARGGIVVQPTDFNPERIALDDQLAPMPAANTGDTLSGTVTGVVDYSVGNFKLLPTATPTVVSGGTAKEVTATPAADQLSMATFNVQNLDPTDPQSKFDQLAATVVGNLKSPDLVTLEEVQDNDGATNSGTVACDQTMSKLIAAITAAGGPSYGYRQLNPTDGADGGEPGGNIRVVFMYRTDRGLSFVDRPGGTATAATTVGNVGGAPQLSYSPGRIDPGNSVWSSTRKPLVAEFRWHSQTVFAIGNHFSSKGGDDPLFGHLQPPTRSSETKRHGQSTAVRGFVDKILAIDPNAKIVVMGDLNDFDFSQTTDLLVGSGATALTDLPRTLPLAERYTYVYEGNSQVLDHILTSASLTGREYDIVHVNSEFATQVSDHDPQVVRLRY